MKKRSGAKRGEHMRTHDWGEEKSEEEENKE